MSTFNENASGQPGAKDNRGNAVLSFVPRESRDLATAPDAERSLLGAVLIDGSLLSRVTPILAPEDFASDAHRLVYEACLALADRREGVDLVTVQSELEKTGRLETAGGAAGLSSLVDRVPDVENVAGYARIVKDAAVRRKVAGLLNDAQRQGATLDHVGTVLAAAQDEIHSATQDGTTPSSTFRWSDGPYDVGGILGKSGAGGPRFRTGIDTLDERLTLTTQPLNVGTPLGRIIGIEGAPSAGKSLMLGQIAVTLASQGLRVIMLVLDEPREDAAERIGQGLGFAHSELNAGNPKVLTAVTKRAGMFDLSIVPNEEKDEEPTIEDAAARLLSKPNENGYVLAIDSAHRSRSITELEKDEPRTQIRKRMNAFRTLTREHRDVLVIYTAEVSRGAYASKDESRRTSAVAAGAEGRDFEYASSTILFLTRDGESDIVHIEVPKNKIGRKQAPFSLRLHAGSASLKPISDEAVEMETQGKHENALLSLVDKIVAFLTTKKTWVSGRAIEDERPKIGKQNDIRDALPLAFKLEKVARKDSPNKHGFLYRVDVPTRPTSPRQGTQEAVLPGVRECGNSAGRTGIPLSIGREAVSAGIH